jgi:hypothetical protein
MKTRFKNLLLLAAAGLFSAAVSATPSIEIDGPALVITGLTPGESVALMGLATVRNGLLLQDLEFEEYLVDSDLDGVVRYDIGQPVPYRSLWAVAGLATGEYTIVTGGFPLREMEISDQALLVGAPGQLRKLRHTRAQVKVLLVRPGEGAWTVRAHKGGPMDDERGNGVPGFSTSLEKFATLVPGAVPPKNFKPRDVVVVIDPINTEYFAVRVGGGND